MSKLKMWIKIVYLVGFLCQYTQTNDVLPAVPLVVKNPYLSVWMSARQLPGHWTTFWTGAVKGMAGLIRVDGQTYEWMGVPEQDDIGSRLVAEQISLKVTPTQSIFTFIAGPVELTVNFFTPIDPTDLQRLSLPASYITVTINSTDTNTHEVQLYFDVSAEWTSGELEWVVEWAFNNIGDGIANFDMKLRDPDVLQERSDCAQWGTVKVFTDSDVTYEANECLQMRSQFVKEGKLRNFIDTEFRTVGDRWPGVGFAHDLSVGPNSNPTIWFGIAHIRSPAIAYTDSHVKQLWESYFNGDADEMISFFFEDCEDALKRAQILDAKILNDARNIGGDNYAKIVSAALRQAYAGIELVGTIDKPWLMLKEPSGGNCQAVDVIYPHYPVQLYLNPTLVKYLLEPLLENQERGFFPHSHCMHDLGTNYPRCIGHIDGNEFEAMEIEESANMLIMMAAYVKFTGDADFTVAHYNIAKQWTEYLVNGGLIPGDALTTDNFLGRIQNSTNLSIKAIIGIGGMAQLAEAIGNSNDQNYYRGIAKDYVQQWREMAEDPSGDHIMLSYNTPDTWFMIYNLFSDVLLGTNLVPKEIFVQQDNWYLSKANKYGVPLRDGQTFTKIDWSLYLAASSQNEQLKALIYARTALWLTQTPTHVPFSDWVDTVNGTSLGFINRPVIGGIFAPMIV